MHEEQWEIVRLWPCLFPRRTCKKNPTPILAILISQSSRSQVNAQQGQLVRASVTSASGVRYRSAQSIHSTS